MKRLFEHLLSSSDSRLCYSFGNNWKSDNHASRSIHVWATEKKCSAGWSFAPVIKHSIARASKCVSTQLILSRSQVPGSRADPQRRFSGSSALKSQRDVQLFWVSKNKWRFYVNSAFTIWTISTLGLCCCQLFSLLFILTTTPTPDEICPRTIGQICIMLQFFSFGFNQFSTHSPLRWRSWRRIERKPHERMRMCRRNAFYTFAFSKVNGDTWLSCGWMQPTRNQELHASPSSKPFAFHDHRANFSRADTHMIERKKSQKPFEQWSCANKKKFSKRFLLEIFRAIRHFCLLGFGSTLLLTLR